MPVPAPDCKETPDMARPRTQIQRSDILPMEEYGRLRAEKRQALLPRKRLRRIEVGPSATVHFESFETMWFQIHEMLYIERGGEAQIADELAAYNSLVPNGRELVATLMFEIPDPDRRRDLLGRLGGVEETVSMQIDGLRITAVPETDIDRTNAAGKASSVQFLHFPFTPAAIAAFGDAREVLLAIDHPAYGHRAVLTPQMRAELATDFDPGVLRR
jgi:hypothetical protein